MDHDYLAEAQQISAKVLHNSNLPLSQDNTSRALSASSIKTDFFLHHTHSVQFDYSAAHQCADPVGLRGAASAWSSDPAADRGDLAVFLFSG